MPCKPTWYLENNWKMYALMGVCLIGGLTVVVVAKLESVICVVFAGSDSYVIVMSEPACQTGIYPSPGQTESAEGQI